ncbi:GNAT family N-acetyltransferase [Phenylobacterium sp.]|uniref:GNAT family N-acetyltransferase n=1 Tax=Phenylobacterium sp. TaxID=1871053 RepID=UPI002F93B520
METVIRSCTPADAAALALVGQATFLQTYADVLPASDILAHCQGEHAEAYYAAKLAEPAYGFWIAELSETGAPIGYAMLCPPDLPVATTEADLELKRIYLLHRFHGTGLGAGLMAMAANAARQRGAERLLLGVYGGNTRAMAFYARQGFAPAGERKFKVGANEYDDLVLARAL